MYDNDRDATPASEHDEEAEHENGGLRSTVNRFWERLTRQNHADYVDDEEYEEAATPSAASAAGSGGGTTTTVGGARVYGVGTSGGGASTGGASYARVTAPQPARSRDTCRLRRLATCKKPPTA